MPDGFDPKDIDVSSIRLNGAIGPVSKPTTIGDHDSDGITGPMLKFDLRAIKSLVSAGDKVPVEITGFVNHGGEQIPFKGGDIIRVR